jgi:hypothetical protein
VEEEEGDKHDLETVMSFSKAYAAYKTVVKHWWAWQTEHFELGIGAVSSEM